jgi:hypothetical protein
MSDRKRYSDIFNHWLKARAEPADRLGLERRIEDYRAALKAEGFEADDYLNDEQRLAVALRARAIQAERDRLAIEQSKFLEQKEDAVERGASASAQAREAADRTPDSGAESNAADYAREAAEKTPDASGSSAEQAREAAEADSQQDEQRRGREDEAGFGL